MKHLVLIPLALTMFAISSSFAQDNPKRPDIEIVNAWTRATGAGLVVGAGYMVISNRGIEDDRLLFVSTSVAEQVEIHSSSVDNGIARMRHLTDGLRLAPGQSVELTPGGIHLMLIGLKQPLQPGSSVPITLRFEKAGAITTSMTVMMLGARPPKK